MKKWLCFLPMIVCLNNPLLLAGKEGEPETFLHKKSLTLSLRDLSFEGGVGGTFWLSTDYSVVLLINGFIREKTSVTSGCGTVSGTDIYINPILSLRRHVFAKENITPFVGITIQPAWFVGDYSKVTELRYGAIFGVESWLTESITLTGEQSVVQFISLNTSHRSETFGRSSISISFYF